MNKIMNLNQPVNQDKYGKEFDRIFNQNNYIKKVINYVFNICNYIIFLFKRL